MSVPQARPAWHSSWELQSPSSSPQGLSDEQKCSSPRIGWKQQSTSDSKPSEAGQLFDPQKRSSRHSSWASQFPSYWEQVLQWQNSSSPLLAVAQLTKEIVLTIEFSLLEYTML